MSPQDHFDAEQAESRDVLALDLRVVDENLAASISQRLAINRIPCILWGNYLLTVYGVPSIVNVSSRLALSRPRY